MTHARMLVRTQPHEGLEAWRMDAGTFPLPVEQRPALAEFLQDLMQTAAAAHQLTEAVWIEATHIHLEGATKLLAPNARAWAPRTGFGVHPDGEMPRLWTDEDFSGAPFGKELPVFNNQVFEVSRATGNASAIETMAGRGLLAITLLSGTSEACKAAMQAVLGPLVQERSFHAYAFFFPLLTAASAGDPRIMEWMGTASVYLREVFEQKQIHILSTVPLAPCLQAMGAEMRGTDTWVMAERRGES